jgi:hypothetical protein
MFDRADLKAAEAAGILSRDQLSRLEAFLAARADPARPAGGDSESLRFLNNFNDIFITIGIVILAIGLTAVAGLVFQAAFGGALMLGVVAAGMWLLAEYFGKRRRMLLPTMALIAIFTLYTGLAIGLIVSGVAEMAANPASTLFGAAANLDDASVGTFIGGAAAAALAWWRFRLPFALFLVALSIAGAVYTATGLNGDVSLLVGGLLSLVIGLATLAVAIWFDSQDTGRITRKADYAFWLHMAAAPQIILGVRGLVTGNPFGTPAGIEAVILLVCLMLLGVLSIGLNRRALIISGLVAVWLSLDSIVSSAGGSGSTTFIATALILGTSIVLLGGGWHTARRFVLRLLPRGGFFARIFPPERTAL